MNHEFFFFKLPNSVSDPAPYTPQGNRKFYKFVAFFLPHSTLKTPADFPRSTPIFFYKSHSAKTTSPSKSILLLRRPFSETVRAVRTIGHVPDATRGRPRVFPEIPKIFFRHHRLPSGSNMRGISRYFSATSKAVFRFCSGLSFDNLL